MRHSGHGVPVHDRWSNVLDCWVKEWRKQDGIGKVIIVRYADDFVVGFQRQNDAVRFLGALRKQMEVYHLRLHPEKTRLIEFGRFAATNRERRGQEKVETFYFLGFTHICGKRRSDGGFTIWRHSISTRLSAKVAAIGKILKQNRALPLTDQGRWLGQVVRGWLGYHAIPDNSRAIHRFRNLVVETWLRALRRRSQKARILSWTKMRRIANRWLPAVRILHPFPSASALFVST